MIQGGSRTGVVVMGMGLPVGLLVVQNGVAEELHIFVEAGLRRPADLPVKAFEDRIGHRVMIDYAGATRFETETPPIAVYLNISSGFRKPARRDRCASPKRRTVPGSHGAQFIDTRWESREIPVDRPRNHV